MPENGGLRGAWQTQLLFKLEEDMQASGPTRTRREQHPRGSHLKLLKLA